MKRAPRAPTLFALVEPAAEAPRTVVVDPEPPPAAPAIARGLPVTARPASSLFETAAAGGPRCPSCGQQAAILITDRKERALAAFGVAESAAVLRCLGCWKDWIA